MYMDTALPFRPRSFSLIFTALADALFCIMRAINTDNYIDNFITVGAPASPECEHNATVMHETYM